MVKIALVARIGISAAVLSAAGCSSPDTGCPQWNRSFDEAIRSSKAQVRAAYGPRAVDPLAFVVGAWDDDRGRRELWERVATGKHPLIVLLEISRGNKHHYLLVESTGGRTRVEGSLFGSEVRRQLARGESVGVVEALLESRAWELRTEVDASVSDGTSYFASICIEGHSGQFAVYGLPVNELAARGRPEFAQRTSAHRKLIERFLGLVGMDCCP